MTTKQRWGSQPGKGRGAASRSERAYIARAAAAIRLGEKDAANPTKSEASCPPYSTDWERLYWLSAFRRERRR